LILNNNQINFDSNENEQISGDQENINKNNLLQNDEVKDKSKYLASVNKKQYIKDNDNNNEKNNQKNLNDFDELKRNSNTLNSLNAKQYDEDKKIINLKTQIPNEELNQNKNNIDSKQENEEQGKEEKI